MQYRITFWKSLFWFSLWYIKALIIIFLNKMKYKIKYALNSLFLCQLSNLNSGISKFRVIDSATIPCHLLGQMTFTLKLHPSNFKSCLPHTYPIFLVVLSGQFYFPSLRYSFSLSFSSLLLLYHIFHSCMLSPLFLYLSPSFQGWILKL